MEEASPGKSPIDLKTSRSEDLDETETFVRKRNRSSIDSSNIPSLGLATKINYPKKRVSVACEICRLRKTRCDAKKPTCTFCLQIGADCSYRKVTTSSRPDNAEEEGNLGPEIISRLDRIERILQTPILQDHQHVSPTSQMFSSISFNSTPRSPLDNVPPPTAPPPPPPPPSSSLDTKPKASLDDAHLIIGFSLVGLTRLPGKDPIPALSPLIGDGQEYLLREIQQSKALLEAKSLTYADLDLSGSLCWETLQSFIEGVLPWFPIFDEVDCRELFHRTIETNPQDCNLETSLILLMLALGSFAKEDQHMDDDPSLFPGIDYFLVANNIVRHSWAEKFTLLGVQCHILISFYCLFTIRPFQAFESIHQASTAIIALLQMRNRLHSDKQFEESCHRAYWTCYLIEHELQAHVSYSSRTLDELNQFVPLPTSYENQSRFFWFSSEIALRRIFTDSHDRSGWNAHTDCDTPVVEELAFQINEWYDHLPRSLKFFKNTDPIYEPRMAFLRAQYYCCFTVVYWPFVLRLMSGPIRDRNEQMRIIKGGAKSFECGVLAIITIESLLQKRHVFLLVDLMGIYCVTMLLLCAYNAPEIAEIQHPHTAQAIQKSREMIAIWIANPLIAALIEKMDNIMGAKGIPRNPMARAAPTSLMTARISLSGPSPPGVSHQQQQHGTPSDPGLVADGTTTSTSTSSSRVISPEEWNGHYHNQQQYQKRPRMGHEDFPIVHRSSY